MQWNWTEWSFTRVDSFIWTDMRQAFSYRKWILLCQIEYLVDKNETHIFHSWSTQTKISLIIPAMCNNFSNAILISKTIVQAWELMCFLTFTIFNLFHGNIFQKYISLAHTPPTKSLWTVLPAADSTLTLRLFQQVAVRKLLYVHQPNKFCFKGHIL